MQNLVFTQLSIPEVRQLFREELQIFFAENCKNQSQQPDFDETGGVEFAAKVTGLAIPTIYTKVSLRQIPHSKPRGSKKLIFSRRDLENWMREGKRRTASEIATEAAAI